MTIAKYPGLLFSGALERFTRTALPSSEDEAALLQAELAATVADETSLRVTKRAATLYCFNFLTPKNFGAYFQYLRDGNLTSYRSELDVKLAENAE